MLKRPVEYYVIEEFYGGRCAERSGLPLMNHVDEGIEMLAEWGVETRVIAAWCIHPIVQDCHDIDVSWSKGYDLACQYRAKANAYLCAPRNDWIKTHKHMKQIVGHMYKDCALLLKADKLQNQKDFREHHLGTHPRSAQLEAYFIRWLKYLDSILKPRNYSPSPKQVLARDHNWAMGNLFRLSHSTYGLDWDVAEQIGKAVAIQMEREKVKYTQALAELEDAQKIPS